MLFVGCMKLAMLRPIMEVLLESPPATAIQCWFCGLTNCLHALRLCSTMHEADATDDS